LGCVTSPQISGPATAEVSAPYKYLIAYNRAFLCYIDGKISDINGVPKIPAAKSRLRLRGRDVYQPKSDK
jgi:hypothetical protein